MQYVGLQLSTEISERENFGDVHKFISFSLPGKVQSFYHLYFYNKKTKKQFQEIPCLGHVGPALDIEHTLLGLLL